MKIKPQKSITHYLSLQLRKHMVQDTIPHHIWFDFELLLLPLMCFDFSQINVILCYSFMEYFYTPHAFGINKQLNFKFLFIVSTLCNCYQVVSLFHKDSSFALGNSFIIYWQSKSTERWTCLHLADLWGLLNLSKIFKNRMRFYSYGSVFLNCKQF